MDERCVRANKFSTDMLLTGTISNADYPSMKPTRVGKLITAYIEANGLTQEQFGDQMADVTQGRVSQWVHGEPIPPLLAIQIEKKSRGALSRYDLCPKVFQRDSAA